MEKKRILVVDDEQDLCDILLFNLQIMGFQAEAAYSAEEALGKIMTPKKERGEGTPSPEPYDLMLLDVMMPGMSGFELAAKLKADEQTRHIPIIFLTAKDTEDDLLQGFSLGADDYVKKPFSIREVIARVNVVINRNAPPADLKEENLRHEGLVIDDGSKTTTVDGTSVALTRTEFELLRLLMKERGKVFSRRQLLDLIWPSNVVVIERTVDVNIARLRKKLGRYAACLVSRTGFGYSFEPTDELK